MPDTRDQLADALRAHADWGSGEDHGPICACGFALDYNADYDGWSAEDNHADHLADVLLSLPGIAVIQLPEPDDVGTFGSVWNTDGRFRGPIGTVQYRPETGRIEIRDDYEHDYAPSDVKRDAAVLLAAAVLAERAED